LVGYKPYYFIHAMRGALHSLAGRVEDAERDFEIAMQSSGATGYLARVFVVDHCQLTGDAQAAMALARQGIAGVEETGSTAAGVTFTQRSLGVAHALNEEWPQALAALEGSCAFAREAGTFLSAEPQTLSWVARAHLELGELDRARDALEASLAVGDAMGSHHHVPHCRLVEAKLLRANGATQDEIEIALDTALEAARKVARFYEPLVHLEAADFAAASGNPARQRAELEAARALFAEMGVDARAKQVAEQLAQEPIAG
jgi:hypothetical protein